MSELAEVETQASRSQPDTAGGDKLLGLELVRFACACSILLWHYQIFAIGTQPFARERQPFYSVLHPFYDYGLWAVQAFWVISGFIFFWKYRDVIAGGRVGARQFFILRLSRLYPLHFATLLLVAALQGIYFFSKTQFFVYQNNDAMHFALQLLLASDWGFQKGVSFNGPIWSISIEVLVYIAFFALLKLGLRSIWVNVAIVAVCVFALFGLAPTIHQRMILGCFLGFYLGGLAAIAKQAISKRRYRSLVEAGALGVAVCMPLAFAAADSHSQRDLWVVVGTSALLLCMAQAVPFRGGLRSIVEAAGNMTYSSYLLHFPFQFVIVLCLGAFGLTAPMYDPLFFLGFIGATLLLAYWTYRCFEAPAQKLIRAKLL